MKKLLLGALLAAVSAPAMAQSPLPDADPAMWVVKDEDTTIYLFGTFHLLDGKQDWFNDEVKEAYDASSEIVLEAVLPENEFDLVPIVLKYAEAGGGKTLASRLPAETAERLRKALDAAGAPAFAFERYDPWFASMTLTTLGAEKLGLTREHGPETVLTKAAKKDGKPVGELEGFEFQMKMFDGMSEEQQVAQLGQTLNGMATLGEHFGPMKTAWAEGNVEKLVEMMNQGMEETPDLYKTIFTDRNTSWAEWIDARMDKPGTVFVAVGAGHLAGKDSVQELLEKRGIKSERVTK